MREFVREELPALVTAWRWAGSLVARSSAPFAVLAGIGADRLSGEVLRSVGFAVLEIVRPERAPRPYDLQEMLGPAIGLLVARRAGGRSAALGYVGYVTFTLGLGWIARALTCAGVLDRGQLGIASYCAFSPLDLFWGALPALVAVAIGAIPARAVSTASRAGSNALLEAAGAYSAAWTVLALGAQAFVYQPPGPAPAFVAYVVGTVVIAGLLAGAVSARRSATPLRTAVVFSAILLATWLYPLGWSQLAIAAQVDWRERPELLLSAVPVLGAAVAVAAAALARPRTYDLAA